MLVTINIESTVAGPTISCQLRSWYDRKGCSEPTVPRLVESACRGEIELRLAPVASEHDRADENCVEKLNCSSLEAR